MLPRSRGCQLQHLCAGVKRVLCKRKTCFTSKFTPAPWVAVTLKEAKGIQPRGGPPGARFPVPFNPLVPHDRRGLSVPACTPLTCAPVTCRMPASCRPGPRLQASVTLECRSPEAAAQGQTGLAPAGNVSASGGR